MRTDNNSWAGMEALAHARMEFIEWLCEKHNLDFAEEQKEFEQSQLSDGLLGKDVEGQVVWEFHKVITDQGIPDLKAIEESFRHEHGTHSKGVSE